jgi:nicotinamidase-related amidase
LERDHARSHKSCPVGTPSASFEAFTPATIIDKTKFSGFAEPQLFSHLQARDADGLVITGSETDVCVLGTVLGAVDAGYRVIIVRDAICSSSDEGHNALMEVYHSRFSEQIETANADEILEAWS